MNFSWLDVGTVSESEYKRAKAKQVPTKKKKGGGYLNIGTYRRKVRSFERGTRSDWYLLLFFNWHFFLVFLFFGTIAIY
jgi:hypothetical protein